MLTAFVFVAIWFVLSVSIEARSRALFWFYLDERVEDLNPLLAVVPGYLERRYARWCEGRGEAGRRKIWVRYILTANALGAGVCAAVLLVMLVLK